MTGESNVVVLFPYHDGTEPTTLEAVNERVDVIREVFAEAAAEAVTSTAVQAMVAAGYPIDDYEHGREIALVQTAIKSLMMASRGIHHALQDTAADMFDLVDFDEWSAEEISE